MNARISAAALAAALLLLVAAPLAQAGQLTAGAYTASVALEQVGEGVPPLPANPLPPGTRGGGGSGEEKEIEEEKYSGPGTVFGFENVLMASCKTIAFSGALTAAATSLTTNPLTSECRAFGFLTSTVLLNGCQYRFNVGAGEKDNFAGTVDLVCPAGKMIQIQASTCEVQIPPQNGLGPIEYENLTEETKEIPKPSVAVYFEITSLTYTKTKDGLACPLAGTGTSNIGVILGSVFAHAESGGFPVSLTVK